MPYFSGWWEPAGSKWYHNGIDWRPSYLARIPALGTETSKQATLDREIITASQYGIDYFGFLWHDLSVLPLDSPDRHLNDGPNLFIKSAEAGRIGFCIEFCNSDTGLTQSQWNALVDNDSWMPFFQHSSYLKVSGKLVFTIHHGRTFIDGVGGVTSATTCLTRLRNRIHTVMGSSQEVIIGGGLNNVPVPGEIDNSVLSTNPLAQVFDFTYIYGALPNGNPFEHKTWTDLYNYTVNHWQTHGAGDYKPYYPTVMTGWDPRPWEEALPYFDYPARSSFETELWQIRATLSAYSNLGLPASGGRQMAYRIHDWNEYAEGGFVAPTTQGDQYMKVEALQHMMPLRYEYYSGFNTDGYMEDWSAVRQIANVSANCGMLSFDLSSASDPVLQQSRQLDINAATQRFLMVRLRNNTPATQAGFYWITNTDPVWGGSKYAAISIIPNDPNWRYYRVDLSAYSSWANTVQYIRFDPVEAGSFSGHMDIDFIEVSPYNTYGHWLYDVTGGYEGWTMGTNIGTKSVSSGSLHLDITGTDPIIYSGTSQKISSDLFKYVKVRMANQGSATTAKLFWTTNVYPTWDGTRSHTIAITPNSGYTDYTFDLRDNTNWENTITQLRLDPVDSGAASGQHVDIDRIDVREISTDHWTFTDGNYSTDRWTIGDNVDAVTYGAVNGSLHVKFAGLNPWDPYIYSGKGLRICAATRKKVKIRMANQSNGTSARLFWTTNNGTSWSSSLFSITPNSGYTDYTIDLDANQNWVGTVQQLRLDPVDIGAEVDKYVDIDQIDVEDD